MAVEISYYVLWMSVVRGMRGVLYYVFYIVLWFVHIMHHYSRQHNRYYFYSSLYSFIDVLSSQSLGRLK